MAHFPLRKKALFILIGTVISAALSLGWGIGHFIKLQGLQNSYSMVQNRWQSLKMEALQLSEQAQKISLFNKNYLILLKKGFLHAPKNSNIRSYLKKGAEQKGINLQRIDIRSEEKDKIIIYDVTLQGESCPDTYLFQWMENLEKETKGLFSWEQVMLGRARLEETITSTDFLINLRLYFYNYQDPK